MADMINLIMFYCYVPSLFVLMALLLIILIRLHTAPVVPPISSRLLRIMALLVWIATVVLFTRGMEPYWLQVYSGVIWLVISTEALAVWVTAHPAHDVGAPSPSVGASPRTTTYPQRSAEVNGVRYTARGGKDA